MKDTKRAPEHPLSRFEQSVIVNLMPISWLFLGLYHFIFALETIWVS